MSKELTTAQKKEWAQLMFCQGELTQKAIALKVKVSEKTMSEWVNKGQWEKLRKSLLTTKNELLRFLYNHLDKISKKISKDDENDTGDAKMADQFVKYSASIKNLETETSIGQIIEVARLFINFLLVNDPALALEVTNKFDLFIKDSLKK